MEANAGAFRSKGISEKEEETKKGKRNKVTTKQPAQTCPDL